MRTCTLASLSLCAVLSAGCGRRPEPSQPPEPQQTAQDAGPGADSCAVYVQRVATGVRCQEVDHDRCACELIVDETAAAPPLLDAGDGWLRQKFTEMGAIQFEDWADTGEEYEAMQLTDQELAG